MNTPLTPEKIRQLLEENGMKQKDLCPILSLTPQQLSNLMTGARKISDSEQSLLKWYFLGIIPPSITNTLDLKGVLEFTEAEWACIGLLAKRAGQSSHAAYIRSSILVTIAPYMEREVPGNSRNGKTA